AMLLAFWLGRPYVILEIIEDILQEPDLHVSAICNALMCLIELGCTELAKKQMDDIMNDCFDADRDALTRPFALLKIALEDGLSLQEVFDRILALKTDFLRRQEMRVLAHQIELAIDEGHADEVAELFESVRRKELPFDDLLRMDMYRIWAYLHLERWEEAGEALHYYPIELLNQESSILHPLYGCWLRAAEGKEISHVHFAGVLETPFPRSWVLLGFHLHGKPSHRKRWFRVAFMWEKRQLYRQLSLYYRCAGKQDKEEFYQHLEEQEYLHVSG
ncbi:MAG: hypothetical protein KDK78_07305, partial [Chlamydiia bacterium]|nr:hypothetical protein [Chlamydiia bacterium]